MRSRARRIAIWALVVLLGLPALALGVLASGPGGRALGDAVAWLSGGTVRVSSLAIDLSGGIRAARIEVADGGGTWLTAENVAMAWSPRALLSRTLRVRVLTAARITVARLPVMATTPGGTPAMGLPLAVSLDALHVARLQLAAPVAGATAELKLDGAATLASPQAGRARLTIVRLDGDGRYEMEADVAAAKITARLDLDEPEGGLVGGLAGLPALGKLTARATIDGPLSALAVRATLAAGPLEGTVGGLVDLSGRTAKLDIIGRAPAMTPRPGLGWKAIVLDGHVEGAFAAPDGTLDLHLDGLQADGVEMAAIAAKATATGGRVRAEATLSGVLAPGMTALAATPVTVTLDGPIAGPLDVTVRHELVEISGTAQSDGSGVVTLTLPKLAPLQAVTGLAVAGRAEAVTKVRWRDGALAFDATGTLALTEAPAPTLALLGNAARFAASGTVTGADLANGRFELDGAALGLRATGGRMGGVATADWHVTLTDLALLAPNLGGALRLDGKLAGPLDRLTAQADLAGDVAVAGGAATPVAAQMVLHGLPGRPSGTVTAGGTLDGATLALAAALARDTDGTLHFEIKHADWKSATGQGQLVWRDGAAWPTGEIDLGMPVLADAGHLLGLALRGGVTATARLDARQAVVSLKLSDGGLAGVGTARTLQLDATLDDPMGARVLGGKLVVAGLAAGGMASSFTLDATGPADRIALRLDGVTGTPGAPVQVSAAGLADWGAQRLALNRFQAVWRGEKVALAGPVVVNAADGLAVDRLRLTLRDAGLDVAGRLLPTLDVTANLRNLPVALTALVAPGLKLDGRVQGSALLTGNLAAPTGTVRLSGSGLRRVDGLAGVLKPGSFSATARLAGGRAEIDARADSGDTSLTLAGTAPLGTTGRIDLRLGGHSSLGAADAVLAAGGRRLRGSLTLDATIGGTISAPLVGGRLGLTDGEVQDAGLGVRIRDLTGEMIGDGEIIRLLRLNGRAGHGTVAAQGSLGLGPGLPVQAEVTLRQAQLLASSLVNGSLDADLQVSGGLATGVTTAGKATLGRTDIRVPEKLPASVAVLDVRRPGDKAPAPPTAPLAVGLDITLLAPGQVFLRGRGIEAELAGELHVGGDAGAITPRGALTLRRGTYTLAGQVLNFTSGEISLDGNLPIDPVLDFKATASKTGTAGTILVTVAIGGHASKPTITVTSVPELPADEVLSQLLFDRSATALGPVELAQLAAALGELAGVGSGLSPLDTIRAALGLDRLSVGGGDNGTGASVQAGRTLAPGVYVGAKQSTGAGGTQATVQIDLYKGLKLKADVGTPGGASGAAGDSGSGVGLSYQFEY